MNLFAIDLGTLLACCLVTKLLLKAMSIVYSTRALCHMELMVVNRSHVVSEYC